jgi:hypothetical protein
MSRVRVEIAFPCDSRATCNIADATAALTFITASVEKFAADGLVDSSKCSVTAYNGTTFVSLSAQCPLLASYISRPSQDKKKEE